ncbi:hypothetical protein [Streptomyces cucumeris]|uniref:hypothetical protein n=1 Tax=Streptomyces cucumeris TaxID=2962890 RepID=UPI0020C9350F|nr:hypothetical protein [Streptomyces sp. NEAU-Y11]MCP9209547.1 hypothetical protein [Streptomyces sp. NEAU-Y11]
MAITRLGVHGKNSSVESYARVLDAGDAFKTEGSLGGGPVTHGVSGGSAGRLDAKWHLSVGMADYVVWSYGTPIAWRIPGEGWVIPEDSYSVITSRQQHKIRAAVHMFFPDYQATV